MSQWNTNPSWTPKEQINGGQAFANLEDISASDFNKLVENMQYLYVNGGDFDLSNFPVGAVYISSKSTSPAYLFGGTWEQIKDVFPLAAGDTYPAGTTGGEAAHILTENEMPAHEGHLFKNDTSIAELDGVNTGSAISKFLAPETMSTYGDVGRGWNNYEDEIYPKGYTKGGSWAHNNMPPYKAYYMWERIA